WQLTHLALHFRKLTNDVDTHTARSTGDHTHSSFKRKAVHVRHLVLSDLAHLLPRNLPDLVAVGLSGTGLDFRRLLELNGYGRLFYNKVERLIAINRDDDWKHLSRL